MTTWLVRIIWLLLLGCLAGRLQAQPLMVDASMHLTSLAGYLSASPVQGRIGNAQQALALYRSGGFEKLPGHLGRGYRAEDVWLAFDLQTVSGAPEMLVAEVGPAFLDHVTAYQADAAGQLVTKRPAPRSACWPTNPALRCAWGPTPAPRCCYKSAPPAHSLPSSRCIGLPTTPLRKPAWAWRWGRFLPPV